MANISKINFNGEALDIKDTYAREQIGHLTSDNYTADVTGDYTVNAGDIAMSSANATMHTTADRTIDTDGNDSVHIDGYSTLNVGGLRTETFAGNKNETVTGTYTATYHKTATDNADEKRIFNAQDIVLNPVNPLTYKKPEPLNDYFDRVVMKSPDGVPYNVLVNCKKPIPERGGYLAVIGDSFSSNEPDSLNARGGALSWVSKMGDSVLNYSEGGAGYVHQGVTTRKSTFSTQADQLIEDAKTKTIDTVIVYGGINDVNNNVPTDSIITEMKKLLTKLAPVCKNIHVFSLNNGNYGLQHVKLNKRMIDTALEFNVSVHDSIQYLFMQNGVFMADNLHPNNKGEDVLYRCIKSAMNGSDYRLAISAPGKIGTSFGGDFPITVNLNTLNYSPVRGLINGQMELTINTDFNILSQINESIYIDFDAPGPSYSSTINAVSYTLAGASPKKSTLFNPYITSANGKMRIGLDFANIGSDTNTLKSLFISVDTYINNSN